MERMQQEQQLAFARARDQEQLEQKMKRIEQQEKEDTTSDQEDDFSPQ